MTRSYDMTLRGRRAARTTEEIISATEELLAEGPVEGVTLDAIARAAGISVQTVLRHMGSRKGCFEAVGERLLERVEGQRGRSVPGDVRGALADLLAHYESEGRLVLNLLAAERSDDLARSAVDSGRAYHRDWVLRCFGDRIDPDDRESVDAIVAATDLYVWKLLRLDLGRDVESVKGVMHRLVHSVLEVQ